MDLGDVDTLLSSVRQRPIWKEEEVVHSRAASIFGSRLVYVLLSVLVAALLITCVVLVGVMVGRRDPDISAAVRHLFVHVEAERRPVLPQHYPGTDHSHRVPPDLMLVVGDAWAGGAAGVSDVASDSWWAQMRMRHLPAITVIRATNATAGVDDVPALIAQLKLPTTLQGRRVALVVQCGWNDVVRAQTTGQLDALDVHALVGRMVDSIAGALDAQTAFSHAAGLYVYLLDYPDPSAGTGFTDLACAPPLSAVYNHAGPVDAHLRALEMLSRALLVAAHEHDYAFVPLRLALHNVGASGVIRSMAPAGGSGKSAPVGVTGQRLPEPPPAAFDKHCDAMSAAGQGYQGDLVAAYVQNERYFIVG